MDIERIGYHALRDIYDKLDYKFYDKGDYNLNIGGIRSETTRSDKFDDFLFVAYFVGDKPHVHVWNGTTDPGAHWLLNPMDKDGTAIMVPGQYIRAYKMGIHGRSGKYPYRALEQIGPMSYVRDNNKDNCLDFSLYRTKEARAKYMFTAVIKSNIHRASKWKLLQLIGRYSAGCQVFQSERDFNVFMDIVDRGAAAHGNLFTYTLIEERDFA
jgi:hypothetical protein